MLIQKDKACGVDVHRDSLVATILSRNGTKVQREFGVTISELFDFREWLASNECKAVAMESTGTYWIPVYTVLEDSFGDCRSKSLRDQAHPQEEDRSGRLRMDC